jgi:hypothetical protein
MLEPRTFHGPVKPQDFAQALIAEFHQGNLRAKRVGRGNNIIVQVASRDRPTSGGRTALTIHLAKVEDGVHVRIGQQEWLGVAASLGATALWALMNPRTLLSRLDDIAQDISSLQLTAKVWETIERIADNLGASYEISERLRRLTCEYCKTANPVGEPHCIACGAPMGVSQPEACQNCGNVVSPGTRICPNCGEVIS